MSSTNYHVWSLAIRYGSYFAAGWLLLFWKRWLKSYRESAARGWPSVEGVIVGGKVAPIPKTSRFHATLQYTYFVEEYRVGEYVHEFSREPEADDFVRQMKDKRVHIRYKQSNPDKSVLEQSVVEQQVPLAPRFG
jgi:hypothetical protein